jgi:tetratricopeptide (TPR) repeat protein
LISSEFPTDLNNLLNQATQATPPALTDLDDIRGISSRSLADLGQVPILLAPRQLTLETRPIFRWVAVTEAESYTLSVTGPTETWEVTLATNEIKLSEVVPFVISEATILETVYPIDAFPLEPGMTYIVTLQAHLPGLPAPRESDEPLYFELVNPNTAVDLVNQANQIQNLDIPDKEKFYLLSLLYRQSGLWTAAIDPLERLAQRNPEAPPLLQLGELYLRAGLTDLAQANYQQVLEIAQSNNDSYTQAAALTGLGQTAYVAEADKDAAKYFEQAITIYQELNEETLTSTVKGLLAEINE